MTLRKDYCEIKHQEARNFSKKTTKFSKEMDISKKMFYT